MPHGRHIAASPQSCSGSPLFSASGAPAWKHSVPAGTASAIELRAVPVLGGATAEVLEQVALRKDIAAGSSATARFALPGAEADTTPSIYLVIVRLRSVVPTDAASQPPLALWVHAPVASAGVPSAPATTPVAPAVIVEPPTDEPARA